MKIQHYLDQLIVDMHQSAQHVPLSKIPDGTFDPDYQDELEASPDHPMSQWFGVDKESFPSSEMLTLEELDLLANEFELMWAAYSFFPEFPEGLPAKRRYELMREYLDYECQHWPGGWNHHFTFCDYEPEHCPFGIEFCTCKEFEDDNAPMVNKDENTLPFLSYF